VLQLVLYYPHQQLDMVRARHGFGTVAIQLRLWLRGQSKVVIQSNMVAGDKRHHTSRGFAHGNRSADLAVNDRGDTGTGNGEP